MKAPTKKDLYAHIAAVEAQNAKLQAKMDEDKVKRWNDRLPLAFTEARKVLSDHFGCLLTLLRFEHVDAGGYWFTFELTNDSTRQTYCVRHNEIEP